MKDKMSYSEDIIAEVIDGSTKINHISKQMHLICNWSPSKNQTKILNSVSNLSMWSMLQIHNPDILGIFKVVLLR
jgi:hypothetical protein